MLLSEQLELIEARSIDKRMERAAQLFDDAEESGGFKAAISATAKRIQHASGEKLSGIISFLTVSEKRSSGDRKKAFQNLLKMAQERSA